MTYEYVCTSCGHAWEAEQPISAPPLKVCPSCHAEAAKRQVSGGAGFILKGGGWYADGYGSKKTEKSGDAAEAKPADKKKSNGETAKTETAKTDSTQSDSTKTETKSETKTSDTSSTAKPPSTSK